MSQYGSKSELGVDRLKAKARNPQGPKYTTGVTYTLVGEVFSVKEKEQYSRYNRGDPHIYFGISFKVPDGSKFWFPYEEDQQEDNPLKAGDAISLRAEVKGISSDGGMYFLKDPVIHALSCTHKRIVKKDNGYRCAGCDTEATVVIVGP